MAPEVMAAQAELSRFGKLVKLKAFQPFESAEQALENQNDISEGILNSTLKNFLEMNLDKPKPGKLTKFSLGVGDVKIGQAIQDELSIKCINDELVAELLRGVRTHLPHYIKELKNGDQEKAQLGLAHSYSRAKVKFNVNRVDNMVIQSIALLDQLDKDVNTFSMRVREWFSWHFPELAKIVNDNYQFAKLVKFIKRRSTLTDESLEGLKEIVGDDGKAQEILDASRSSMGTDISDIDMINIESFSNRVISLTEYRKSLHEYLLSKMNSCAPNLSALTGELVGARLISHAGSLTNLAKYPASTIQILGAEKALFRALKTKGNTPKYGLIFHSSFIGRAAPKNKGRISRYLANKCAIASRLDCFTDVPSSKFGEKLREQVEERLKFYETGATPRKNIDVMRSVLSELSAEEIVLDEPKSAKKEKKDKKRKSDVMEVESAAAAEEDGQSEKKKKKKSKSADDEMEVEQTETKKEKKKKSKSEDA